MVEYAIFVRDANRQRVAQVSDYGGLALTLKHNGVGAWNLTLPVGSEAARWLDFGGGIVVDRDATTIFSGPMRDQERRWNAREDVVEFSGQDDTGFLADRLASPQPQGPVGVYTTTAYDVRAGVAETILREYVDWNAGASALGGMRVPGLALAANAGAGSTITGRARFDNLLEFLQGLATAGGVSFRVLQAGTALTFQVYVPADKTGAVVFSTDRGTLRGYRYRRKAPEANYEVVGGGLELTSRVFVEGGDQLSQNTFGRIVQFRDRRDTTDTTELGQQRDADLSEKAEVRELSIEPIDTPAQQYVRDYALGDRVTVVVDTARIQDVVREVRIRLEPGGTETVTPVVGTAEFGGGYLADLFWVTRQQRTRLSQLERRR